MDRETAERMSRALDAQLLDALENGTVALKGGEPIIIDGPTGPVPLRIPPSASILNVVRQRLAGVPIDDITKPEDIAERMQRAKERMMQRGVPDDDVSDEV